MILSCFRQIRSAYHPDFGESAVGDKYHKLIFLIWRINQSATITFGLGPNSDFDEGAIANLSRFYYVQQYNKDNLKKIRIGFFVLADSKYYFVWHLDVYQGNNAGNIDIHHRAKQLPTTMKAVNNSALAANIANDYCGTRKLFFDKRYAFTELFVVLFEEMNLIGGGTCRKNRIGFSGNYEWLTFPIGAERGAYGRLYNR